MHVAVTIVAYRDPDDIVECLAGLARSTYRDFEVVICENGGEAAHAALAARVPSQLPDGQSVRLLLAPGNLGYAGGINRCVAASPDADAWWVLNPDAVAEPAALEKLVETLRGGADIVGGVMFSGDGRVSSYGGRWRPWLARAESIGHGEPLSSPVDRAEVLRQLRYIPGGCMLFSRRFLQVTGPMREDYFLYVEEVEWSLRGGRAGMRLGFAPEARVLHNQGATTGSGMALNARPKLPIYLDERNRMLLTRDCYPARLVVAAPAALALIVLRYGRRRAWRQMGDAVAGWMAGLANRRGVPDWLTRAQREPG